jgi:predicted transcriptional regulator
MKIMLGIRIDPELKDSLQKLADEEDRSLSNFVVRALLTYIKEHKGVDWKKTKK